MVVTWLHDTRCVQTVPSGDVKTVPYCMQVGPPGTSVKPTWYGQPRALVRVRSRTARVPGQASI
jgi:hypothetical protein